MRTAPPRCPSNRVRPKRIRSRPCRTGTQQAGHDTCAYLCFHFWLVFALFWFLNGQDFALTSRPPRLFQPNTPASPTGCTFQRATHASVGSGIAPIKANPKLFCKKISATRSAPGGFPPCPPARVAGRGTPPPEDFGMPASKVLSVEMNSRQESLSGGIGQVRISYWAAVRRMISCSEVCG